VAASRRLERADALAELALRYFTGHGPATEQDLAYWATLTLTDVRAGLRQVHDQLDSFTHDGRTFWHAPGQAPTGPQEPAAHLLQILDETYRGYQDSRWVLDTTGQVPRTRETAAGMALVDAQLLAAMRRTVSHDPLTRSTQRSGYDIRCRWKCDSKDGITSSAITSTSPVIMRMPSPIVRSWYQPV